MSDMDLVDSGSFGTLSEFDVSIDTSTFRRIDQVAIIVQHCWFNVVWVYGVCSIRWTGGRGGGGGW